MEVRFLEKARYKTNGNVYPNGSDRSMLRSLTFQAEFGILTRRKRVFFFYGSPLSIPDSPFSIILAL
jgi:hypothetical protein